MDSEHRGKCVDEVKAILAEGGPEVPVICHIPELVKVGVGIQQVWVCDCGYIGNDMMMTKHVVDEGWCGECWGSGSTPYPSLGLCHECRGTGEQDTVRERIVWQARRRREMVA